MMANHPTGIMGVALLGLIAGVRHYMHVLDDTFAGCNGIKCIVSRAYDMDDLQFIGLLVCVALLAGAVCALVGMLRSLGRANRRPSGRQHSKSTTRAMHL